VTPTTVRKAVPDPEALVARVLAGSPHAGSRLHGEQHWQAVARAGAELIEAGSGANPAVVFCFALVHDSQRFDDGTDPDHGPRAAHSLPWLSDVMQLSEDELNVLADACTRHSRAGRDPDATVGTCFDADRLNLWRVGTWPDPAFLSTAPARDPRRIEDCSARCLDAAPWPELYSRYLRLG
jgi:uncharacterized protein